MLTRLRFLSIFFNKTTNDIATPCLCNDDAVVYSSLYIYMHFFKNWQMLLIQPIFILDEG